MLRYMPFVLQVNYQGGYSSHLSTPGGSPEHSSSTNPSSALASSVPSLPNNHLNLNVNTARTYGRAYGKSADNHHSKFKTYTHGTGSAARQRSSWAPKPVPSLASTQPDAGINRTHLANTSPPIFFTSLPTTTTDHEHKHDQGSRVGTVSTVNPVITKSDPFQASLKKINSVEAARSSFLNKPMASVITNFATQGSAHNLTDAEFPDRFGGGSDDDQEYADQGEMSILSGPTEYAPQVRRL